MNNKKRASLVGSVLPTRGNKSFQLISPMLANSTQTPAVKKLLKNVPLTRRAEGQQDRLCRPRIGTAGLGIVGFRVTLYDVS